MSWVFSFPFFSQAIARFTEFGSGEEDALASQSETTCNVSLHTMGVQDKDDGALLHSQDHGQACGQQLGTVSVSHSLR